MFFFFHLVCAQLFDAQSDPNYVARVALTSLSGKVNSATLAFKDSGIANSYLAAMDYFFITNYKSNVYLTDLLNGIRKEKFGTNNTDMHTGYKALANIRAFDLSADGEFLSNAIGQHKALTGAITTQCGGGLNIDVKNPYSKDTNQNVVYLLLSLNLYIRTKSQDYWSAATTAYNWLNGGSGTISIVQPNGLLLSGLNPKDCTPSAAFSSQTVGEYLSALVLMNKVSGDVRYLNDAADIAKKSLAHFTTGGIIREFNNCDVENKCQDPWKGIYVRGLRDVYLASSTKEVGDALVNSYKKMLTFQQIDGSFVINWVSGGGATSVGSQVVAQDLCNAVLAIYPRLTAPTTTSTPAPTFTSTPTSTNQILACVYSDPRYAGNYQCYSQNGLYNAPWNDQVRAIRMRDRCVVRFYTGINGSGSYYDFRASTVMPAPFDKDTSSFYIYCQ